MNTKFKRDKYGLSLQIIPTNDEERALLAEMVKASPWRPRGVKLNVMKDISSGAVNNIQIMHGGFINGSVLRSNGFKRTGLENVLYRRVSNTLLIIAGTSIYNIYAIEIRPETTGINIYGDSYKFSLRGEDINGNQVDYQIDFSKYTRVRNVYEFERELPILISKYTITDVPVAE